LAIVPTRTVRLRYHRNIWCGTTLQRAPKRFELVFPYRAVFKLEFGPKFKSGVQDGGVGGGVRAAAVRVPRRGSDRGAGPISLQGGAKDMVDGAGIYDPSAVLHPLIRWNRPLERVLAWRIPANAAPASRGR